jgi:outer membrane protein assembly complex protein YaeT
MLPRSLLTLAAMLCLALPAYPQQFQQFEGRPVRQIRIPAVPPTGEQRLVQLLPLKAGEPYTAQRVRDSIQELYATDRFFDIQVDAVPFEDGVAVTFLTTINYFVGGVFVEGIPVPPTEAQQAAATRLELGTLYTDEAEQTAKEGLRRLLEDNGWYQAQILPRQEQHPETQVVDVHFMVTPGDRARIAGIEVTGSPGYSLAKIKRAAGLKPGRELNGKRIPDALGRLQRFYQKNRYWESKIAVAERRFIPAENKVLVVFSVDQGPQVDVRVRGTRLSGGKLRQLLPIYQEGIVDNALVREGDANLRNYLQQKGHFGAQVASREQERSQEKVTVGYDVTPGPKHKVALVQLAGNRYFSTDTLRERMMVTPKALFSRGRYSPEYLSRDVQSIRALYQANGFAQVEATSEVQDNYQGHRDQIAVFIKINEGPQTLVRDFRIEATSEVSQKELASRLAEGRGQPYSEANVSLDRDTILTYYFNEGFRQAQMATRTQPVPGDPNQVDLTYNITEGSRGYVNQVVVSGIENTKPDIVDQQVAIEPAKPLSQAGLLDTQRRLYDLGIFQGVDVAVENRQGREPYKNVLIQVTEARRWTLQVGAGADIARFGGTSGNLTNPQGQAGISPRLSFDVTRLNFLGRAQTVGLKTVLSTLQKRALLGYEAPRIWGRPNLTLFVTGYADQRFDVLTFASRRDEGSVALEQKLGKTDSIFYRYSYRRVTAQRNTLFVSVSLIPLFERPVRVGMLGVSFVRDHRDDPIDTHRGRYLTLDMGIAAHGVGSEASYGRGVARYSTYHPLGRKLVLARSTEFGVLEPFGTTVSVPLPERFFSGGGNSLRGFAVNEAGPRDSLTGFPIGGDALVLNNLELRFPVRGSNITAAVFHDMGNVYSGFNAITFRVKQKDPTDFDYMVHAAGLGIRYKTPVGPVRLDLAYSINPPRFFGVTGTQAPIGGCTRGPSGNPLPPCELRQVSHFQFFFSIGQTF